MNKIKVILYILFFLVACTHKPPQKSFFQYKGYAAGTSFMIEYDKNAGDLKGQIDKILNEIGSSLVFNDSSSLLSRINQNDSIGILDKHFITVFGFLKKIHQETKGVLDPTAFPLTSFWGEDEVKFKNFPTTDSAVIDSIKQPVGFDKIFLRGNTLIKQNNLTILDFSSCYEGYMADMISEIFNNYNVQNYRIEIGGRIRAKGSNSLGKPWQLGIDEPTYNPKKRELLAITHLDNQGYAVAGSFRKYFESNSMKRPFTIDPLTGYPVDHTLLMVSVFAPTCAEAEAYANAFMVMGPDKTKAFLNNHRNLGVYMISSNYKGEWITFMNDDLKEKMEFVKEPI